MVERRLLKNFDFALVAAMFAIIIYGIATVYSASRGGASGASFVHRQVVWAVAGCIAFALAASVSHLNYPRLYKYIYFFNMVLLLAVIVKGNEVKGAQRWIGIGPLTIQPSEFAKVAIIITLAVFLVRNRDQIREFRTFILSFVHVALPMLLIFKQPDLGTALVITAIWFGMTFIAGADISHLIGFVAGVMLIGFIGWHTPILKEYQKDRLRVLLDPSSDARGAGYHVLQARIAIGSGQATGKGWRHGTQGQLGFIPERHTDFIFTVLAEELGFVGASLLLLLYFILIWRAMDLMSATEDQLGRLMAAGVVSLLMFHVVVNIGMTLGIMPVTGVPLPLFSYGGSSLMANMLALGLLVGIGMRRHKIDF